MAVREILGHALFPKGWEKMDHMKDHMYGLKG